MDSMKSYPLITRNQIQARLATDSAFVAECVGIVHAKFLARRNDTTERGGWMASHTAEGERLAKKFADGKQTAADTARATAMMKQYSRALAVHFRDKQLADPLLREIAALYGVRPSVVTKTKVQTLVAKTLDASENAASDDTAGTPAVTAGATPVHDDMPEITIESPLVTLTESPGGAEPPVESQRVSPTGLDLRVLNYVTKNPGTRSEIVALEFRADTSEISASLRRLVDGGWLRREGLARWTKYFAVN